jgi:hypothetical protein
MNVDCRVQVLGDAVVVTASPFIQIEPRGSVVAVAARMSGPRRPATPELRLKFLEALTIT